MFILAIIYLIILVVCGIGAFWNDPRIDRPSRLASFVLFVIIGIALFYNTLAKG